MAPRISQRRQRPPQLVEAWRLGQFGMPETALRLTRQIIAGARQRGDVWLVAAGSCNAAWHQLQLGESATGLDLALDGRRMATELGDLDLSARSGSVYGWQLLELGLTDESYREAVESLALAEASGTASTVAFALNVKAVALMYGNQAEIAIELLHRCVALAAADADDSARGLYLTDLAYGHCDLAEAAGLGEDKVRAAELFEMAVVINGEAIAAADSSGDGWVRRLALCNQAELLGTLGRMEEAHECMSRWRDTPGEIGMRADIHYLYTLGELQMRSGDLQAARTTCISAVRLAEKAGQADHLKNTLRRLAEVDERLGDFEGALAAYKRFHDYFRRNAGETTSRQAEVARVRFESERHRAEAVRLAAEVMRDPLTGIGNRRALEARLEAMGSADYALAIADVDRFKAVNDGHSHLIGDLVLKRLAALLQESVGAEVTVARFGGEEFVLLFTGGAVNSAAEMCETARRRIAAADWPAIAAGLGVTISIGLACRKPGQPYMSVLEEADRRLYVAKAEGRNRLVDSTAETAALAQAGAGNRRYRA